MEHLGRDKSKLIVFSAILAALLCLFPRSLPAQQKNSEIPILPEVADRSTGSAGAQVTADYIIKMLKSAGLETGTQEFTAPVPSSEFASIETGGESFSLHPWGPNLVYLSTTPPEGISGPLIYAGNGAFPQFDGKSVEGGIVLMDMNSQGNWLNGASFGASAIIFLGNPDSTREEYRQKNTTSPLAIPRFWASPEDGRRLIELAGGDARAVLKAASSWKTLTIRNCYGLLRGKNHDLGRELVILEAPYDTYAQVVGLGPGADESVSASILLSLAKRLSRDPPERSILFVFSGGNRVELSGVRHFIQALSGSEKDSGKDLKRLMKMKGKLEQELDLARRKNALEVNDPQGMEMLVRMIAEKARDRSDELSRKQREMRGQENALSDLRSLRILSWTTRLSGLGPKEISLVPGLLAQAAADAQLDLQEVELRIASQQSALKLKKTLEGHKPVLFVSLDLSSHSQTLGLIDDGATYPLKENIKRMSRAGKLGQLLERIGVEVSHSSGVSDLTMHTGEYSGQADAISGGFRYGSDVAAIAGLPAVALVSSGDAHIFRTTPYDTPDHLNSQNVKLLADFVPPLLSRVVSHPSLKNAVQPGVSGFASLSGQAMYIRSGELFPDQPALGTIVSVFQGDSLFRAAVNRDGMFSVPGLVNNRLTSEKAIIESYSIDPGSGRISSAADRVRTGKDNYRVRMKSGSVSTSLVMFRCEQTDVIPVLNPATLGYLTRPEVLDAKTDSSPIRYWSSRMDSRDHMAVSVFLEKGTRFKLGVAESLLGKEFLLLGASPENPTGAGFLIGSPGTIPFACLQTAKDLYYLSGSRLAALAGHGIVNQTLESLYKSSGLDLDRARNSLSERRYSEFWRDVIPAWAKVDVVYREIDREQRDVLMGVIFFIALFIPFAYCMERYIFGFRSIYKQILGFLGILIASILVIRSLHPAFELTYSPMVVILAFFIVGLSLGVSWIIFMRFEREMERGKGGHLSNVQHVSSRQALGAGFAIGVSNLNRRKMRTALTCTTLVILTFTIMSFTNVKNSIRTVRTRIADEAAYRGLLIRSQFGLPMTFMTLEDFKVRFDPGTIWPKGWIKPKGSSQRNIASIFANGRSLPIEGILGVGSNAPDAMKKVLVSGGWFEKDRLNSILLPIKMCERLGMNPDEVIGASVQLLGSSFIIAGIFDDTRLEALKDLDQKPILPAYLESANENVSEAETEAIQSGEQILPQSLNYRYADAGRTVLIAFEANIRLGGDLETIAVMTGSSPSQAAEDLSSWLAYPIFTGDGGAWYESTSTALRYQGAANLLVPILIVILITLNTMISHVYERKREIATYTSVGLAPAHVGFLFIVEALSLAVISTVFGYILAQFSAHFLAGTYLFSQLTFNYSSLASVACMFLVFSVVFLAALYPARVATSIAMPDVNRIWRLPDPEGDSIRMNLPFLLKAEEEFGIMNFLQSYFVSHVDSGHGSFTMDDTRLDMGTPITGYNKETFEVCLVFEAIAWLTPFDFGIKQRVNLHCCPSEHDPGYLEIAIFLTRLSGEHSAWARANKRFVKDLRKQILLWRLLDAESKAAFLPAA